MFETLIEKDVELLIYLNNLGTPQWDGFWLFITNKLSAIPLYVLLLYLFYKQFGLKKTVLMLIFVALLITVSDQTSNLFKYGFKRLRPCYNNTIVNLIRLVKPSCGGKFSYFSAHAANITAIAVFFSLLLKSYYKYLAPILLIWAFMVAYSRVYIGVHYPLDVFTGAFFGTLYGTVFYFLLKLFFKKIIK